MTLVALFAMTTGAWADEATITLKCGTTEKTYENVTLPWSTSADILKEVITDLNFNININAISGGDGKVVKYGNENFTVTGTFSGEATVTVTYNMGSSATITVTAPGSLLTLSEDGKTATMESTPASDLTVDYELVRDLQLEVEFDGLPGNARVAKNQEGKFQLVDAFTINLLDKIDEANVKSITKDDGITFTIVKIVDIEEEPYYRIDEESAMSVEDFLADAQPGVYCIKATASETSAYDGVIYSSMFNLFQGYEVYVPAHEYVTYCSTEALTLEDENAALYTITAVSNSEATLSRALTVAPATMPLLVENNSDESRTILLIPTDKQADDVTPATEFIGVLDADRDLYKNNTFDYYAFNGLDFVLVNNLVTIPVGKCFIGIQTGNLSARSITIRRSATAIDATLMNNEEVNSEEWFDLNGRKVNKPTKKGIYIKNGRKVVIMK